MPELHRGIDFICPAGTPVLAVVDGVLQPFSDVEGGSCLRLCGRAPDGTFPDGDSYSFQQAMVPSPTSPGMASGTASHDDSGWRIVYAHLGSLQYGVVPYAPNVNLGTPVKRGDVIGYSGNSGTRPPLPNGQPNPLPWGFHLHMMIEWLQDGVWTGRTFVDPALFYTPAGPVTLPPGRIIRPNDALIVPAGQPGNTAQPTSVVINVNERGVASVNLGSGWSVAGSVSPNVNLPLSGLTSLGAR